MDLVPGVLGDHLRRPAVDADGPELVLAVAERQRLAVGREGRTVEVALGEVGQHALGAALGRAHGHLLGARGIGGVGDQLAVRRPGRMVFVGGFGRGQVARGAVLGGHAEDVAAGREQGALAVGGQSVIDDLGRVGVADLVLGLDQTRAGAGVVVGHMDLDLAQLLGGQVDLIELAALLERDGVCAQRREIDVVVGEVGDLAGLLGIEVVDPDVGPAVLVLVGQVVDLAAPPHGRGVGPRPVGDLGRLAGVEVVGEHLLGQAAVVALPGAEIPEDAVVGDGVAVGRIGGQADIAVDRHGRGQAAVDRDLVHFLDPAVPLVPLGQIDHELGVRRPGDHHVVRAMAAAGAGLDGGMVGQPPGLAARRRDHPDVGAGLGGFGVGDPASVRRHAGEHVLARGAGQAHGLAAGL